MSLPKSIKEELREAKKNRFIEKVQIEDEIDEKIEEIEVDIKKIKKGR